MDEPRIAFETLDVVPVSHFDQKKINFCRCKDCLDSRSYGCTNLKFPCAIMVVPTCDSFRVLQMDTCCGAYAKIASELEAAENMETMIVCSKCNDPSHLQLVMHRFRNTHNLYLLCANHLEEYVQVLVKNRNNPALCQKLVTERFSTIREMCSTVHEGNASVSSSEDETSDGESRKSDECSNDYSNVSSTESSSEDEGEDCEDETADIEEYNRELNKCKIISDTLSSGRVDPRTIMEIRQEYRTTNFFRLYLIKLVFLFGLAVVLMWFSIESWDFLKVKQ